MLRRSGWNLMPPYGGRVSGRAVCPFCRGVASSEAQSICSLEGRLATLERGGDVGRGRGSRRGALERGGDRPAGPRGLGCVTPLGFSTVLNMQLIFNDQVN